MISLSYLLVFGCLLLSNCGAIDRKTAIIVKNYPKNQNEPVLLSLDYQLLLPSGRYRISLKNGQAFLISCPGLRNVLLANRKELPNPTEASCYAPVEEECSIETRLGIFKLHEISCKAPVWGWTLIKNKTCGPSEDGTEVEHAFQIRTHVIPLIRCCLDIRTSTTFFCKHTIRGEYIADRVAVRKAAIVSGDGRLFDPSQLYKMTNQRTVLDGIVNKTTYLTKGHLAPPEDFLLRPHQMMTYTFANTAPRWNSVNRLWKLVERRIRKIASQQRADLEVVTGTYGVLKVDGRNMMLGDGRLPVPEVFWKVIRTNNGSCIGIICSNNPSQDGEPLCEDICPKAGWGIPRAGGQIYCCTYQAMKSSVPGLPDMSCN